MPRFIKRGFRLWQDADSLHVENLPEDSRGAEMLRLYSSGLAGALYDPAERAALNAIQKEASGFVSGLELTASVGLAGSGAGKLSLPFLAASITFPNCYPGSAQVRGDCVSKGGAGAALITIANEIMQGSPDEVTGEIEGAPEISSVGIQQDVISSEYLWWCRRRPGNGWTCDSVVRAIMTEGLLLKKPYPELNIDLTRYNYSNTAKYAVSGPPSSVIEVANDHIIGDSVQADSLESTRDLLYAGFGMLDCGSQGWSSSRDINGVSARRGSWSHSMKVGAFDDRPWAHEKYGGPLVLIINNWGEWNSGPRDIYDSAKFVPASLRSQWEAIDVVNPVTGNLMIPKGSFWSRWKDAERRYRIALRGARGWKQPDDSLPWIGI